MQSPDICGTAREGLPEEGSGSAGRGQPGILAVGLQGRPCPHEGAPHCHIQRGLGGGRQEGDGSGRGPWGAGPKAYCDPMLRSSQEIWNVTGNQRPPSCCFGCSLLASRVTQMGIISGSVSSVRSPPLAAAVGPLPAPGITAKSVYPELRTQVGSGNLHLPTFLSCPGLGSRSPETQPYLLPSSIQPSHKHLAPSQVTLLKTPRVVPISCTELRLIRPLSSIFYRWGNRGTGKQSGLPRATQLVSGRARLETQVFLSREPPALSCLVKMCWCCRVWEETG